MGSLGVEGGDVDGFSDGSDELEEVLEEEATVECVGAVSKEITGLEGVGPVEGDGRNFGCG